MKKQPVNKKKETVPPVTVNLDEPAPAVDKTQRVKELIEPFKADIQKAREAQDMAALNARVDQFIADIQAL